MSETCIDWPRGVRSEEGRLVVRSYAKINLGLRVFPVRQDGFHDLQTWMVPVCWYDMLSVVAPRPDLRLEVTGRTAGIPLKLEENLVGRAAMALMREAGIAHCGADIRLHKVLPPGGGVGGGSSNAAATLVALNEAWELHWPVSRLEAIAAGLGSDVAYFVRSMPSLCTGRGEIMVPLAPRGSLYAVLILPTGGCATREVYAAFDAGHRHAATPVDNPTDWTRAAACGPAELDELLVNDLEPAALAVAPWLGDVRRRASEAVGKRVHMTGSGSTHFVLCATAPQANELSETLRAVLSDARGTPEETCQIVPVRIGLPVYDRSYT